MKACLEEQNEFWRQQIVQQSKADLTNLQKDDDSLHNDEISPVEKTSTKMQMGILEGPSSFSSSQRQRDGRKLFSYLFLQESFIFPVRKSV